MLHGILIPIIQILHVQKYFNVVLPRVIEGANKVDGMLLSTRVTLLLDEGI